MQSVLPHQSQNMKAINYVFLLICCVLTACDPSDNRLTFVNHSSHPVVAEISNDSTNFKFNNISYYKRNVVLKDSIIVFPRVGSHHAMVDYVEQNPNKKLYLVVFSLDSIKKYPDNWNLINLFKEKNISV